MARGALTRIFAQAHRIAQQQHATTMRHLDAMTQTDEPATGGGMLTRKDHLLLLASDQDYQANMLAKLQWMTPEERTRLGNDLERAAATLPTSPPPEVSVPPASPFGPEGGGAA